MLLEKYDIKVNAGSGLNKDVSHTFYCCMKNIDGVLEYHYDKKDVCERVDKYVSDIISDAKFLNTNEIKYKLKITNVFSQDEIILALGYMIYHDIKKDNYKYD